MFMVLCHKVYKLLLNFVAVLWFPWPKRAKVERGNKWISGEGCPFPLKISTLQ